MPKPHIPQLVVRPHEPNRLRVVWLALTVIWVASLVAAWRMGADDAAPRLLEVATNLAAVEAEFEKASTELDASKDRLAILERSDQMSRTASESLQQTLRDREEEIVALRTDLAFYQRLVGGRAPRQGLAVQSFALKPIGRSGAYAFRTTLTQNLKKAAISVGTVDLSVAGVMGKRLATMDWRDLAQDAGQQPLAFSFKYFERLEGSLMLPEGFTPNRVKLVVRSRSGEQATHTFAWDDAIASGENDDVWQ